MTPPTDPIAAFRLASDLVDEVCALNPVMATQLGVPGLDDEWGESFGLLGVEQVLELHQRFQPLVEPFLESGDARERLAARVMVTAFDESRASYENLDHFRSLRHIASPFHQIRLTFDIMKTDTSRARADIVRRLDTVEKPLGDYRELLEAGLASDVAVSARQVASVIDQARRLANDPTSIAEVVAKVETVDGPSRELTAAAEGARAAFAGFADWLEARYLPHAVARDGVGREAYERAADRLVGMSVDPLEAYEWGWDELRRLLAELEEVAEMIRPGDGVDATKDHLETDPGLTASSTAELLTFVDRVLSEAVTELAGSHFDVPDEIRPLTVQLAPAGSPLGVYYRRPSEDFSRPGGVWYSLGEQETLFPLYQHVSTAYHEGFPGHHLQIAIAMYRRDSISRFQRLLTWCPGYGEGWGMYAEVLMGELGYLEDPSHYFGMLAKQLYRAARVVVDIGLHLGLSLPESSPIHRGEQWSFESAVEFMRIYGFRTGAQAREEVLRYLGWPGQAISYKLGEREILRIRESARQRLGDDFELREFHSTVIGHGTIRLDLLREVVEEQMGP